MQDKIINITKPKTNAITPRTIHTISLTKIMISPIKSKLKNKTNNYIVYSN